ncbi:MAG TPA: hypothetical protein VLI92_00575 [Candidatus Saccharimonadales bacterium]|nr:hypothetical protein [Candidatus Saccharimonadales bacterium]
MKKVIFTILLATIFIGVSYFINNKGECCDQFFHAGWPFSFYGGSGGFVGIREDKLIMLGLVKDAIFWFVISFTLIFLFDYFKGKNRRS